MILVDRTLYSDLLYLKDHITTDPIQPKTESEYGLISSGLLVSAGPGWEETMGETGRTEVTLDAGNMLFNYTRFAKRLAKILFQVNCPETSSNIGLLTVAANGEVSQMLDEVWGNE